MQEQTCVRVPEHMKSAAWKQIILQRELTNLALQLGYGALFARQLRQRSPALPGNDASPRALHSASHRSINFGLSCNRRATLPPLSPASIARITDIFKSRLYALRAKSIAFSIQCT
jgi:hypothetical protein